MAQRIQVQEGYLKITQATCNPNVVHARETYVETADLPVLATANKAAKWTATLIIPAGVPPRVDGGRSLFVGRLPRCPAAQPGYRGDEGTS